ncbi:hypothetical protein OH76DRAFT_834036 [Lentinus brumalis]|uniref:Uncharacterized protein n=1 Tax=Lentinus brumalis TaxID=2498619 RepID=A0A371D1Y7_9APHY|nr:hypothetical protein OH76DRAFT_834036 [Polyporus brumalis]
MIQHERGEGGPAYDELAQVYLASRTITGSWTRAHAQVARTFWKWHGKTGSCPPAISPHRVSVRPLHVRPRARPCRQRTTFYRVSKGMCGATRRWHARRNNSRPSYLTSCGERVSLMEWKHTRTTDRVAAALQSNVRYSGNPDSLLAGPGGLVRNRVWSMAAGVDPTLYGAMGILGWPDRRSRRRSELDYMTGSCVHLVCLHLFPAPSQFVPSRITWCTYLAEPGARSRMCQSDHIVPQSTLPGR